MAERTVAETISGMHQALQDYIEATYHISDPGLVHQRLKLLGTPGIISQRPYVESTPRYQSGKVLADLGLPPAVTDLFSTLSKPRGQSSPIIYDPLYHHQSEALIQTLNEEKSLIVMTGTGSGKTECFLLPILGKLALEAASNDSFQRFSAVRAIVLYPMNALVNDQLGRMRLLYGDPRVVEHFHKVGGRPARFARYTSRTLYPGVRTPEKDSIRLAPIGEYFVRFLELAQSEDPVEREAALALIAALKKRGKWPAKPDLLKWYGKKGDRWYDPSTSKYKRCVTLPDDSELLTRHEVLAAPPDILVTNYSMLEYMLMRPIERPIFDKTREWLKACPKEKLLLVLDEAHLYHGAAGAEVALLLRRLRQRLGIPADRLQVICTSASFREASYAPTFAGKICGKAATDFVTIQGKLQLRAGEKSGVDADAVALTKIDLTAFYESDTDAARLKLLTGFLASRGVSGHSSVASALYAALENYGPMSTLVNLTMKEAKPVEDLSSAIFPGSAKESADRAITVLMALGSIARKTEGEPGLLPCRVHAFYRGLPGLWICMDADCTALSTNERNGIAGKLYAQPRDYCSCGARVLEFFTCRNCGTAHARAYTDNLKDPDFLWSEAGGAFRSLMGRFEELQPLDILLEQPIGDNAVLAEFDLVTGRMNPPRLGTRNRQVSIPRDRVPTGGDSADENKSPSGQFRPCAVCQEYGAYNRSTVQDHQTKGDEPFQTLIARQIQMQPPSPRPATKLAPMRGRKVLVFSDSRQTAARLAPNLQDYSVQDALRPLLILGFKTLQHRPEARELLSLDDSFLAVLLAAKLLKVRLRPELKQGESFESDRIIERAVADDSWKTSGGIVSLIAKIGRQRPPSALLLAIIRTLKHPYYGLESLALASLVERSEYSERICKLPDLPGFVNSDKFKLGVARLWIRAWRSAGFWLSGMPPEWARTEVSARSGKFKEISRFLNDKNAVKKFETAWLPSLLEWFTERIDAKSYRIKGSELTLDISGAWAYCKACKTTQRPIEGVQRCINCELDKVSTIDPDTDPVFLARKSYYRLPTLAALRPKPEAPVVLIAAEHTAQLNTAQNTEVFSRAEENELLFQDVDLGSFDGRERPAIDVLCSTTTMEVGIDIGALSGVSLRNMPPARANYQQRAGRAGRRGNAIATVTAFGSADSHDEHYFSNPDQMIRGPVEDPTLTLDNAQIAQRHVTAFLLQRYHQERLPKIEPSQQPQLFAVLGNVDDFKNPTSILNRDDFGAWLSESEESLRPELDSWLPIEIETKERAELLKGFVSITLEQIDFAIKDDGTKKATRPVKAMPAASKSDDQEADTQEIEAETGDARQKSGATSEHLLDRLLYKGVLPRYAFPTDVATFYVFDNQKSTSFRPSFQYTPSQGLTVALSQYAPGKEVWIGGKVWTSGAIYSPIPGERYAAWEKRKLYFECSNCRYARTVPRTEAARGEIQDCAACGKHGSFGKARYWLRPPGFAHPTALEEGTTSDDQLARSYATRAKLLAPTPVDANKWRKVNAKVRSHFTRDHLLVTNSGPKNEGYTYCGACGLIEPTALLEGTAHKEHAKPYPDQKAPLCPGGVASPGLVLGTDFISDVLLASLSVQAPVSLLPGLLSTDVALRTLSEALTSSACSLLELDRQELQAEFRPALTENGWRGLEAEIYLYDTLPGGAGFSQRVGELGIRVFNKALEILEGCAGQCDRSCYRCIRSYKNKFEHELLDRHLGAALLRYLLKNEPLKLPEIRLNKSTDLLFEDLSRKGIEGWEFSRSATITVPGMGPIKAPIYARGAQGEAVIALHTPLTPNEAPSDEIRELRALSPKTNVILIDELVVSRSLPRASLEVMSRLGITS